MCFLIGFGQQIPGFPQYWMNLSDSLGIYDLNIFLTDLSDEAQYQCQVGPASGNSALSSSANLTITGLYMFKLGTIC